MVNSAVNSMKNWQGIPTTRLTVGGEVMVPRDNGDILIQIQNPRCQDSRSKTPKSRSRNQDPEIKIQKSRSSNQDPEIKIPKSRS